MSSTLRCPALLFSLVLALASGCSPASGSEEILAEFPIDSIDEVITRSGVTIDSEISADGSGSLRVEATEPTTVRIVEIEDPSVENARLIYRARLRSEGLVGKAYLEMWCIFPGLGEFFSRALHSPLSGTNEWTSQETPFFLKQGQDPSTVKLNLVVEGKGTVWIDQIVLAKGPL
jgi:hypothetical protein